MFTPCLLVALSYLSVFVHTSPTTLSKRADGRQLYDQLAVRHRDCLPDKPAVKEAEMSDDHYLLAFDELKADEKTTLLFDIGELSPPSLEPNKALEGIYHVMDLQYWEDVNEKKWVDEQLKKPSGSEADKIRMAKNNGVVSGWMGPTDIFLRSTYLEKLPRPVSDYMWHFWAEKCEGVQHTSALKSIYIFLIQNTQTVKVLEKILPPQDSPGCKTVSAIDGSANFYELLGTPNFSSVMHFLMDNAMSILKGPESIEVCADVLEPNQEYSARIKLGPDTP
ncbi:hypothetical protein BDV95DRAFT_654392 [Massariosphaeria phaeospora]|uniref:Uncharacterized protein n=1 Tax=Massariosphaeria phaeospora TaxID=100035 RepID=A0A7C8MD94_9PLEO|nr:hypothetical protein BDV95DRAFT_654392 [Massariosphaeria phaeospora]